MSVCDVENLQRKKKTSDSLHASGNLRQKHQANSVPVGVDRNGSSSCKVFPWHLDTAPSAHRPYSSLEASRRDRMQWFKFSVTTGEALVISQSLTMLCVISGAQIRKTLNEIDPTSKFSALDSLHVAASVLSHCRASAGRQSSELLTHHSPQCVQAREGLHGKDQHFNARELYNILIVTSVHDQLASAFHHPHALLTHEFVRHIGSS